uniref:Uncharacterized protein n=1 Tax=Leersia perrieri TaxID=77586 RepID=A0A0D9UYX5_9ORYZ
MTKEGIDIDEDTDLSLRRCTSIGEAVRMLPTIAASENLIADWFQVFYIGPNDDNQIWFAYNEANFADNPLVTASIFENPSDISLSSPLSYADSTANFLACIRPCLLPSGISSGRKSNLLTYEFYYPSIAARQFGLGQLPIKLHFADKLKTATIIAIILHPSSSKSWDTFWDKWSDHLYHLKVSRYCKKFYTDFKTDAKPTRSPSRSSHTLVLESPHQENIFGFDISEFVPDDDEITSQPPSASEELKNKLKEIANRLEASIDSLVTKARQRIHDRQAFSHRQAALDTATAAAKKKKEELDSTSAALSTLSANLERLEKHKAELEALLVKVNEEISTTRQEIADHPQAMSVKKEQVTAVILHACSLHKEL